MASKRNKFAPRNIGADAAPRSDHMLVLLPPAKEKIPFFDKYKNTDRTKGVAFKTINDPNANKVKRKLVFRLICVERYSYILSSGII